MDTNIDSIQTGAPDLKKQREDLEREIRAEIESTLGHLSTEIKEAMIRSRVSIAMNSGKSELVKVDLGENAGRRIKDHLFE